MKERLTYTRPIPNFPDYEVARDGRVWSKPRKLADGRNWQGKWLKLHKRDGYLHAIMCRDSTGHNRNVHRLVLETYVGPCPKGMECRHLDGNRANNHIDNLKWGTRSENQCDRVRHGTSNRGEQSRRTKLTDSKVKLIRQLWRDYRPHITLLELGAIFGVHESYISLIVNRKRWAHVA